MPRVPIHQIISGSQSLGAQWVVLILPRRGYGFPTTENPAQAPDGSAVLPNPPTNIPLPERALLLAEAPTSIMGATVRYPAANPTNDPAVQSLFEFPCGTGPYLGRILGVSGIKVSAAQSGPTQTDNIPTNTVKVEIADPAPMDGETTFASYAETFIQTPGDKFYGYYNSLAFVFLHTPGADLYCRFWGTISKYPGENSKFTFEITNLWQDATKNLLGSQQGDVGGCVRLTTGMYPFLSKQLENTLARIVYGVLQNTSGINLGGMVTLQCLDGVETDYVYTPANHEGSTWLIAGHPATLVPKANIPPGKINQGNVYYLDPISSLPVTFSNYCKVWLLNSAGMPGLRPLSIVPVADGNTWVYTQPRAGNDHTSGFPVDFPCVVPPFLPDNLTPNPAYYATTPQEITPTFSNGTPFSSPITVPVPVFDTFTSIFNTQTGCQECRFTLLPLPVDNTTSTPGAVYLFPMTTLAQSQHWDGKYNSLLCGADFNFDFLNDDLSRVWYTPDITAYWPANNAIPPRQTRQAILKICAGQFGFTTDQYFRVVGNGSNNTLKVFDPNNILGPFSAYNGPGNKPANQVTFTCQLYYLGPSPGSQITADIMGLRRGNLLTGPVMTNPAEITIDFLLRFTAAALAFGWGAGVTTPIPCPNTYQSVFNYFAKRKYLVGDVTESIDTVPAEKIRNYCYWWGIQLTECEPQFLLNASGAGASPPSAGYEWYPTPLQPYFSRNPNNPNFLQLNPYWRTYGRGPVTIYAMQMQVSGVVPIRNIVNTFQGWPIAWQTAWRLNEYQICKDGQQQQTETDKFANMYVLNAGLLPSSKTGQQYIYQLVPFEDADSVNVWRGKYVAKDINLDGVTDQNTIDLIADALLFRFRAPMRRFTVKTPFLSILRNPGDVGIYTSTTLTNPPNGASFPGSAVVALESIEVDWKSKVCTLNLLDVTNRLAYQVVLSRNQLPFNTRPGYAYPTLPPPIPGDAATYDDNHAPPNPQPEESMEANLQYPGLANPMSQYFYLCNNKNPRNTRSQIPSPGNPTGAWRETNATGFFSPTFPNDPGKTLGAL